ncbi:hypothetical protein GALMADRAFT_574325 [Galerina marginata CBS 339.88]|uniref:Uncharacterized protein n=1 Tax=Galerina marginata (strain CBS 339.88) TaxID=685588 RepID=A0A067T2U7_GALM3|nr:hypothetical protein GALMADRAFT_574325 [Galerina marginata CBS 339.88]
MMSKNNQARLVKVLSDRRSAEERFHGTKLPETKDTKKTATKPTKPRAASRRTPQAFRTQKMNSIRLARMTEVPARMTQRTTRLQRRGGRYMLGRTPMGCFARRTFIFSPSAATLSKLLRKPAWSNLHRATHYKRQVLLGTVDSLLRKDKRYKDVLKRITKDNDFKFVKVIGKWMIDCQPSRQ